MLLYQLSINGFTIKTMFYNAKLINSFKNIKKLKKF